jgi:hypothetical protein
LINQYLLLSFQDLKLIKTRISKSPSPARSRSLFSLQASIRRIDQVPLSEPDPIHNCGRTPRDTDHGTKIRTLHSKGRDTY